jgi:DNA-binding transcriptional LysR family regulator
MDVSLRTLRYFIAAADHGNVTQAARDLKVSQPSVSLAIAQVEKVFNAQLFVRQHSRGVALTPLGTEVLREARKLLAHAKDFSAGAGQGHEIRGTLSIGCLTYIVPRYLPGLLRGFLARHANVEVDFRDGDQGELVRGLDNGELEAVLTYDLMLPRRLAVEPLLELKPYVLVAADHRLTKRKAIHLREIADEPCVLLSLPISHDYFAAIFGSVGLAPNIRYRTVSVEATRSLVSNGLCYSILTLPAKTLITYDGRRLAVLRLRDSLPPIRIASAHLADHKLRPVGQAFLGHARAFFRDRAA